MRVDRVLVGATLSWLGLWVHELHRVPGLFGFTPDGALPMLAVLGALAFWWYRSHSSAAATGLLMYAAVNLVGGFLTVLPLGWLPFQPEQRPDHYAAHAVYAACQLPLIAFATREALRRRPAPAR
jgi:hypothetical protein